MLTQASLDRFSTSLSSVPYEAHEMSECQRDQIHQYIEEELQHEGEIPTIDRIICVFNLHEDDFDEAEAILQTYDGEQL